MILVWWAIFYPTNWSNSTVQLVHAYKVELSILTITSLFHCAKETSIWTKQGESKQLCLPSYPVPAKRHAPPATRRPHRYRLRFTYATRLIKPHRNNVAILSPPRVFCWVVERDAEGTPHRSQPPPHSLEKSTLESTQQSFLPACFDPFLDSCLPLSFSHSSASSPILVSTCCSWSICVVAW